MSRHRHKTDLEKEILKKCTDECNQLPRRSPLKREIWEKYVNILKENGFDYTADEIYAYYNNRKNDDKRQQPPPKPQENSTSPTPFTPEPSPTPSILPQQQNQAISPLLQVESQQEPPFQQMVIPPLSPSPFFTMVISTPPPSPPPPPPSPSPPSPSPHQKSLEPTSTSITTEFQQKSEQSPVITDSERFSMKQSPYSFSNPNNEYSPSSSSTIVPFDEISESNDDELMKGLINTPQVGDDISQDHYDNLKYRLYDCIQSCYGVISRSYDYYKSKNEESNDNNFRDELLKCQEKVEKTLVDATDILTDKLNIKQIYSYDKRVPPITGPKNRRTTSRLTRIYNNEEISPVSSGEINAETTPIQFNSSANLAKISFKSSADKNTSSDQQLNDYLVVPFNSNRHFFKNLPQKLQNFYMGVYDRKTVFSQKIDNYETATIISFKEDQDNEFLDFAYVSYQENTHVLHFRNCAVETGFFLRATAMYFHQTVDNHSSNDDDDDDDDSADESPKNLLYICGDKRVKEFSIKKLNKGENDGQIEIVNTRTFYFGADFYQSSVITVWQDELVLGCGSTLYFWSINGRKSDSKRDLRTRKNLTQADNSGVDIDKVDWTQGQLKSDMITIETMEKITSLAVIEGGQDSETYLAVSSETYPVVYIYNSQHEIVKRLISHTMGVTSIKFASNCLFSGSLDYTVKLWDLEKCRVEQSVDTLCQKITVIQTGYYEDKFVLLTAGENSSVMAWSITDKRPLFEISLGDDFRARHLAFVCGKNEDCGEFARLMIISDYAYQAAFKTCRVNIFEFK